MPLTLFQRPQNRRGFLATGAAGLAWGTIGTGRLSARAAERPTDPNLWVWLNDTHVSENTGRAPHGQNIADNLRHVVRSVVELKPRPAGVMINGDCAHNSGLPGDYRVLREILKPLGAAGIPVHLTLGNHDDRDVFFRELPGHAKGEPVPKRHVMHIESPAAHLLLLDSLKQTNIAAGDLGVDQLAWVRNKLEQLKDRPVIVLAHHNPQWKPGPPTAKFRWSGLEDTPELFPLLLRHRQVKAYVHGHAHHWRLYKEKDLHVINTPATGYVADPAKASTGWTLARLRPDGVSLTRYCINPTNARHGTRADLTWRV